MEGNKIMEISSHERNGLSELSFRDLWEGPLRTDSEAGSSWSVGPLGTLICRNRWPLGQRKNLKGHRKTRTKTPCPLYVQGVFSHTLEVSAVDLRMDFSGTQVRLQMELS